jgi:bifunctional non-homologous end joining protein LigD
VRRVLPKDCALDGELLAVRDGKSQFSALLEGLGHGGDFQFVAFDLVELNGEDLSTLPLRERRDRLMAALPEGPRCICTNLQTDALGVLKTG